MIENITTFYEKLEKDYLGGGMKFFPWKNDGEKCHRITDIFFLFLIKLSIVFDNFPTFYPMDPKSR